MEQWFAFKAYNQQTLFGFGTAEEASQYEDRVNSGKEINHYHAHVVSDSEAADLRLEDNTEAFNLSDALAASDDA